MGPQGGPKLVRPRGLARSRDLPWGRAGPNGPALEAWYGHVDVVYSLRPGHKLLWFEVQKLEHDLQGHADRLKKEAWMNKRRCLSPSCTI